MKIQDIARLADVSPATVSRVFSHHPNVNPAVRSKVLSIAQLHGYRPRVSARQRNVVIILPSEEIYPIRNCLEMAMMALTAELPRRGLRIEVLPLDNIDRLDSIQFCGAVAIGVEPDHFRSWSQGFAQPLVLVDRPIPAGSRGVYSVRSDEAQGMDLAIGHLYERGCRKIGCVIHGTPGKGNADARHRAIVQALTARGLPGHEGLIHFSNNDHYVEIIGKLLQQGVDALFCPGGNAGIVTAYALSLFNRRVPHDISVVASEHKQFSRYATPPQTTITPDHQALANHVANLLESPPPPTADAESLSQVLPYQLISRDSVRQG